MCQLLIGEFFFFRNQICFPITLSFPCHQCQHQIYNSLLQSQFKTTDFLISFFKPSYNNFLTSLFHHQAFLKATITIYLQHFSKPTLVQQVSFTIKVFSTSMGYLQHSFNKYFSPSMFFRQVYVTIDIMVCSNHFLHQMLCPLTIFNMFNSL